jgi:hypothetical protein
MAFWASVWDAIAPPIDTDQGSVPFGEAAAGARTTPGAAAVSATQAPATVARLGFDSDVPWGGANKMQPGGDYPDGRANFMSSLYTAYVGCPWLAAPIDVIARTVTAGGVQITPTSEADDQTTADPPPQVQALQQLLDFCNPHMDIVQLLRGVVVDLGIYGDAFLEVVWLLGLPVALFPLDPATMSVDADEHGEVTGYDQVLDTREVHFEPHQIIHISMDAPKGSLYGMGIAQKALLPTTVWLFTEACIKETMRRGDPPHIHVDWPLAVQPDDVRAWRGQYRARNLGPQNIGNPITTRGGATLTELQLGKLSEYLDIQVSSRDTILSVAGVPPAKVGVIESGNLGGGTGTSQDKTFRNNTCGPVASIVLEKLNFSLTREAFGVTDWEIGFVDVDWRDDTAVEEIRDKRLRNGSWTLNDYLTDLGKPTVGEEGDVHALLTTKEILTWEQLEQYAQGVVDGMQAKTDQAAAATQAAKDQAQAAKDRADAAKTAAANGAAVAAPEPGAPGTPPQGSPPGTPPSPAAGTHPAGSAPPTESSPVPRAWTRKVAEQYRQLIAAGKE